MFDWDLFHFRGLSKIEDEYVLHIVNSIVLLEIIAEIRESKFISGLLLHLFSSPDNTLSLVLNNFLVVSTSVSTTSLCTRGRPME